MSDGGRLLSTEGAIVPKKLPACSREYRRPWRLSRLELVKSALGGVSLSALLGGFGWWRMLRRKKFAEGNHFCRDEKWTGWPRLRLRLRLPEARSALLG